MNGRVPWQRGSGGARLQPAGIFQQAAHGETTEIVGKVPVHLAIVGRLMNLPEASEQNRAT